MELIRLENLCKTYHVGEIDVPALRDVSLTIGKGEMVALMGASGSGKTTLMNLLGCLDHPTSGKYWLDGQEMSKLAPNERALVRSEKLGFVFQNFNLLPRTTALQNVLMPLDYAVARLPRKEAWQWARTLLDHIGLADRADHEPSQLSGGQQQRVAIGRSLVGRPALLLADEPTGNLDSHTSVEILRMFQQLNAEGITVILVTHDPNVAAFAHRIIRIHDGRVTSDTISAPAAGPENRPGNGDGDEQGEAHPLTFSPHLNFPQGENPAGIPASENEGNGLLATAGETATAVRIHPPAGRPSAAISPPATQKMLSFRQGTQVRPQVVPSLLPHTVRTAFGALRRNKMRSLLTTLGIVIGVAAVIAMVEIGQGSAKAIQAQIASMGASTLMIQPGAAASGGVSFGLGSAMTLTPEDAEEIARQCPSVADVAPVVRSRTQIVYGSRNWVPMFLLGTTPDYLKIREWTDLAEGIMFSDSDVSSGSQVCVIGDTLKRELFEDQSPVGKSVRINNVSFRVIGVLSHKGANMGGMDQDDIVVAPWPAIKYRVSGNSVQNVNQSAAAAAADSMNKVNSLNLKYPGSPIVYPQPSALQAADTPQLVRFSNVDMIMASVPSPQEIPQAIDQITQLLRDRHRIRNGELDDFHIRDMSEITKIFTSTSGLMSILLLVVAMISLVVGGVGIMNIMLVSVTERTREIGLRMAVGARSYHILRQFLVEAVVLCLVGGAIGIMLGRFASLMVKTYLHWPTSISLPIIIAAVAVSASVGVIFGFYPAWKASRLDPIEALRYE